VHKCSGGMSTTAELHSHTVVTFAFPHKHASARFKLGSVGIFIVDVSAPVAPSCSALMS